MPKAFETRAVHAQQLAAPRSVVGVTPCIQRQPVASLM
jgi:hypothetical protein